MTVSVTYALSMPRLVEHVRALAAIHILARQGESPLRELMCEARCQLLERMLRDAFVECVMQSPVPAVDVDIEALTLTLLTPESTARGQALAVERLLSQMVAARALELWVSMSGLTDQDFSMADMVSASRNRLRSLLSPPAPLVRPAKL